MYVQNSGEVGTILDWRYSGADNIEDAGAQCGAIADGDGAKESTSESQWRQVLECTLYKESRLVEMKSGLTDHPWRLLHPTPIEYL